MDRSVLDGFMAVVAASGSVVFVALQVHKRLLSDFMKRLELEIGPSCKTAGKKNVRFVTIQETQMGPKNKKSASKVGFKEIILNPNHIVEEIKHTMPPNRLALYKGIIEFKALKGHKGSTCM